MPIKLLAIGDMHLGRQPSRLPNWLANETHSLGPEGAWQRCVAQAIAQDVDVVVLAGDLVDQEDNFFEAFRPLEQGINRLVDAGIEVIGISGNHDVSVLPRLAEHLSAFKLLGENGQWQRHTIHKNSDALTLHGWSFPKPVVTENPLSGHTFERGDGVNLGLLHCHLDQLISRYAPVPRRALQVAGLDGWLLGHIHKPDALSSQQPVGYLGSVSGLHVGEAGIRGPWLMTIDQGAIQDFKQWRIAPLHWAHLDLDIGNIDAPRDAEGLLLAELKNLDLALSQHEIPPQALGIRLRLTGPSSLGSEVIMSLTDALGDNINVIDIPFVFLESIQDHTSVAIDLDYWATQPNHAGRLANDLLLLERKPNDPYARQLIESAKARLSITAEDQRWHLNGRIEINDVLVTDHLLHSGHALLRDLIAQLEESVG